MADQEKRTVLTREGYEKLEAELNYLKTTKRDEISAQIAVARGFGDLSENAEYDEARKDQARNETKILEIEEMLRSSEVVEDDEINTSTIGVGNTVMLKEVRNDDKEGMSLTVTIVGANEVDAKSFKISTESPIGAALLGHKRLQIVDVNLPGGVVKQYKITKISR